MFSGLSPEADLRFDAVTGHSNPDAVGQTGNGQSDGILGSVAIIFNISSMMIVWIVTSRAMRSASWKCKLPMILLHRPDFVQEFAGQTNLSAA
jgi:hypothetical protein